MPFNSLQNVSSALRASTSRLLPLLRRSPIASSSRAASYVQLSNLQPAPGSTKANRRHGRGSASGKGGHTSGRGHKGAGARSSGIPYRGHEGGQTMLVKRIPKRGFLNFTRKDFAPLNISRLQQWLAADRIDSSQPITINSVISSNLIHGIGKWNGVKLLGERDPSLPLPPLTVRLSRYSKTASQAILEAGGNCLAVYHNKLSLRQEVFPGKFAGREVKMAKPTRRTDIEFYTDPKNFGYLADSKAEFFKERGYDPEKKYPKRAGQGADFAPRPAPVGY